MKKITSSDAEYIVELCAAARDLPKVRRRLKAKPSQFFDAIYLELQAADMTDGISQGSQAYFNLPPALGAKVLDAVEKLISDEMLRLNVAGPK